MLGFGKGRIGLCLVADLAVDGKIVGAIVPHMDRARLDRVGGAHDSLRRLVIDLDQLGRVFRLVERLGDHHRHRLADILHFLGRHRVMARDVNLVIRLEGEIDVGRAFVGGIVGDRLHAVGDPVGAGIDRDHARRGLRGGRVDAEDARRGVRAAHHRGKAHIWHHMIGCVVPSAA